MSELTLANDRHGVLSRSLRVGLVMDLDALGFFTDRRRHSNSALGLDFHCPATVQCIVGAAGLYIFNPQPYQRSKACVSAIDNHPLISCCWFR